jgi:hypothetical protein
LRIDQTALNHHNLLWAKAWPEWDFKYFSNSSALERSLKTGSVIKFHSLYLVVYGDLREFFQNRFLAKALPA